ncbi:MAG: ankyrin repeat domain-containing protein [Pacificimonas sp.]|jgi:ankyrin repeat protein|nr:ankyrin repeat domain-containing protein [Pacificimonas sp.]
MMGRIVLGALALVMGASALPAKAQFSERFEFFEALRKEEAAEVIDMLSRPGQTLVNAKEPNSGKTALHVMVERQEVPWINLLQQKGASMNVQDDDGNTPLLIASTMNFTDGVRLLMHYGADPNVANRRGETPLIRAVQRRDYEMVRVLMEAGADPDQRDNYAGYSARDYAERDRRGTRIREIIDSFEGTAETNADLQGPAL